MCEFAIVFPNSYNFSGFYSRIISFLQDLIPKMLSFSKYLKQIVYVANSLNLQWPRDFLAKYLYFNTQKESFPALFQYLMSVGFLSKHNHQLNVKG